MSPIKTRAPPTAPPMIGALLFLGVGVSARELLAFCFCRMVGNSEVVGAY